MSKRRRRWRWVFVGNRCVGQIEQDDSGWRVIVDGKVIGTVGDERLAAELVKRCAGAGGLERAERDKAR